MIKTLFHVLTAVLPCLIPPYALRLNRLFGTRRVGWVLFVAFSLLAALQILRSWPSVALGLDPGLTLDLLYLLIPLLLLIGLVHIETLFKERLRVEQEERRLRGELEQEVKRQMTELNQTNEELQREISLRRQGQEELRKSKEQYRVLFDENPQPMWIFDLDSLRFLAFNTAALRHYGFSSAEFRDMTAKDLSPPGEWAAFEADCAETSPAVQRRGVWHHCKKDGGMIQVEISTLDLTYGGCAARLVLAHDVTAQRLLQKQQLESQKADLTATLAGGVADNFTRLITVIEGDANALLDRCDDEALGEPLKRIAANAACATGLTRQLLALVRRHPMRPQLLDLNKLLENLTTVVTRLIGPNIQLEKSFWENIPSIMADPALIEQIVRNLVLNARDAMPNGGVLTLSTAPVRLDETDARRNEAAKPGTFVCLMVSDTGCGMSVEVRSRLFEPFFTTKGPGTRTGLGLATVHGLVKQHFGWIEVDAQEGAGSRFTVFLPCLVKAEPAVPERPTSRRVKLLTVSPSHDENEG